MADIFLSYRQVERNRVLPLIGLLEAAGYSVFYDGALDIGDAFLARTNHEIRIAKCILVVWTRQSVASQWVLAEAYQGFQMDKLVPVRLEECQIPIPYQAIQTADLGQWRGERTDPSVLRVLVRVAELVGRQPNLPGFDPQDLPPIQTRRSSRTGKTVLYGILLLTVLILVGAWIYIDREKTFSQVDTRPDNSEIALTRVSKGGCVGFSPSRSLGPPFQDCASPICPVMVPIAMGSYCMGAENEQERLENEGPVHLVRVSRKFAVGQYEVTWEEWEACVRDGGCDNLGPDEAGGDQGWGKGRRPVINVNWHDAQSYVAWLSWKTKKTYRLLSESEWEYVARAGTTTRFFYGDDPTYSQLCAYGNHRDKSSDRPGKNEMCSDGVSVGTAEVGTYKPNAFNLYDVHGNAFEWVLDCWNDSYEGNVPRTEASRMTGDCSAGIVRGGAWSNSARYLKSATRLNPQRDTRSHSSGFRVARDYADE